MVQDYNGISNPSKHQETVLGNRFSFPTIDFLELLGMTIHQDLNFDKHITIAFSRKLTINLNFYQNIQCCYCIEIS